MRVNHFWSVLLIFSLFQLCSCTTTVKLARTVPPEIDIEDEEVNIAFINEFDPLSVKLRDGREVGVYQSGLQNLISGLTGNEVEEPNVKVFGCDTALIKSATEMHYKSVSPDFIKFICEETASSHVLVLDTMTLDIFSEEDEKEEGEASFRDFIIEIGAKMLLYSHNGDLIDVSEPKEYIRHKTKLILIRWIEFEPALAKAGKNVNTGAKLLGQKYVRKFYSSLDYVNRLFYSGKYLEKVTVLVKNTEWIAARDELLKLAGSDNPKIPQKKVAHNLAVVFEALNDPYQSEQWRQKSDTPKSLFY